ncbi:hypothetical protein KSP39_PZI022668 [Platanthera zijinensis]|uniref:DUF674 family protein n=1 Tax=Platanthera zijinensis TaxID=2320716 RepID=A0AAP0FUY6_9ASPA
MSSSSSIKVKFLIDTERKRVVFVEAGSAFVDVLFSFLTLPLGSIVQLLSQRSGLGSLDNLYESVVQLDAAHLRTEACKEMLLHPRSAAARQCENLKIKYISELYPVLLYTCSDSGCVAQTTYYYEYASKVSCGSCGNLMDFKLCWPGKASDQGGVFVNDTVDFIMTDDLRVMQSSFANGLSIFKELQIKDASILEERVIDFGTKEALDLLKRSLISKNALTEFCFPDVCVEASGDSSSSNKDEIVAGEAEAEAENEIILELFLNQRNNEVLYAEVGEDFLNFLFSFLTFPLGSALGFLSHNISPFDGCIHNLYSSAKSMSSVCFKSEVYRDMLLTPKLPAFYEYKKHMLKLKEVPSQEFITSGSCAQCISSNGRKRIKISPCPHGITEKKYIQHNPKSAKGVEDNSGAFVMSSKKFMISDNLDISPLSLISAMRTEMDFPISELVRKKVSIDRAKAQSLLSALLVSKKVLADAFFPKPIQKKQNVDGVALF